MCILNIFLVLEIFIECGVYRKRETGYCLDHQSIFSSGASALKGGGCDFSSGYPLGAFFAQMAIFFGPLIFFEKKIWTPKFFLLIFHTPEIVGPSLTDFQTPYIIDR